MKIILAACNAKYIHSNLAVYDLQAYARQYQQYILLKESIEKEARNIV